MTTPYRLPLFFTSPMPGVGERAFVFELAAPGAANAYLLSPYPSRHPVNRLITLNGSVGKMFNRDASACGAIKVIAYEGEQGAVVAVVASLDQIEAGKLIAERIREAR